MTIDEAISHALDVAGEQQERANSAELIDILDGLDVEACKECAADHRQLAEWLIELKEAKRLLKSAIDEWNIVCKWNNCGEYCGWFENGKCSQKWSGEAEALKLLGGSENG